MPIIINQKLKRHGIIGEIISNYTIFIEKWRIVMDNWIDLSNVPKYKGTGTRGKYVNDWKNASGCKCNFCLFSF